MRGQERADGCLLGLACGDALGRAVTGMTGPEIAARYGRLTEMRSGGPRDKAAGVVTIETESAIRAGRSLVETGRYDRTDVVQRLNASVDAGPETEPLRTVENASLQKNTSPNHPDRQDGEAQPEKAIDEGGCLLRCVPYAIAFDDPNRLAAVVATSAAITHPSPTSVEACVTFVTTLRELLGGSEMNEALSVASSTARQRDAPEAVRTALAVAGDPAMVANDPGGGVSAILEVGLHEVLTTTDAEAAVVSAVNQGGNANRVGAVTGTLAGARFGDAALPDRWLNELSVVPALRELATQLRNRPPD